MILAADIGGTKSLFGLFDRGHCVEHRRLANADFSNFPDVLSAALADLPRTRLTQVCLALAGPIADDGRSATLTNLPWHIDATELARRFELPTVMLVNDFAAAAMGAVMAADDQRVILQSGKHHTTAPHLVVGAGTGLGMAIVLPATPPQTRGWQIVPGEGGHLAFAPADDEQHDLWATLREQHPRVTWERVLSGAGLEAIYLFMCRRESAQATLTVNELATAPADSTAGRAIDLFLRCYGAYAGDMAMSVLARGGVHLAGGIAGHLLTAFERGGFLTAFNAKAEHAALMTAMPVSICTDPNLGLIGAAQLSIPNV